LVLPEKQRRHWENLCREYHFIQNHTIAPGGKTRFHSVKNGLKKIKEEGIVFIHDGVRPLVSVQTIQNCYKMALETGNALPVIPPAESVREVFDGKNKAVNRTRLFLVQTPQTFRTSIIKKAYNQDYSEKFTDDASVLENTGEKIHMVEGNRENIKITYPGDFAIAEAFLPRTK
jgi:2-C-methyl-D-erythritol 4-phosphate cytidylyltransferase